MAVLGAVGTGADRPEFGIKNGQADFRIFAKKRAAPAARAEGRDRGERQKPGAQRHHRPVRGQVIGGGPDRRRQQNAIADQLLDLVLAIDLDADMRRVMRLPDQRDLIDRQRLLDAAVSVGRGHPKRVDGRCFRTLDPFHKLVRGEMVHQEPQPPAIHSEDGKAMLQRFVKHMQHMTVAAKRDNAVGALDRVLAVTFGQPGKAQFRLVMAGC